jgi:2-C-methyl-D-erythritol 4-phosphate cytidylyltransferase
MKVWGVVPAAGMGRRMGWGSPKQYREAAGAPILIHTLRALLESKALDGITVAVADDFIDHARKLVAEHLGEGVAVSFVTGGATRQESVYRALASLVDSGVDFVVIHDAARPLVTVETIRATLAAAVAHGAAVAAIPAAEASCLVDGGLIAEYIDRSRHMTIQTPQAFRFELIMRAHEQAVAAGITDAVDDGQLALRTGSSVSIVDGSVENIKITYPVDLGKIGKIIKRS